MRSCKVLAGMLRVLDRKSTRLNSSHPSISYAVFCFKKTNRARSSVALAFQPRVRIFAIERNCRQMSILPQLWSDDSGQDIAEYAVMLAVILVLVVGTIRLVGSNANNAFSSVASTIQ